MASDPHIGNPISGPESSPIDRHEWPEPRQLYLLGDPENGDLTAPEADVEVPEATMENATVIKAEPTPEEAPVTVATLSERPFDNQETTVIDSWHATVTHIRPLTTGGEPTEKLTPDENTVGEAETWVVPDPDPTSVETAEGKDVLPFQPAIPINPTEARALPAQPQAGFWGRVMKAVKRPVGALTATGVALVLGGGYALTNSRSSEAKPAPVGTHASPNPVGQPSSPASQSPNTDPSNINASTMNGYFSSMNILYASPESAVANEVMPTEIFNLLNMPDEDFFKLPWEERVPLYIWTVQHPGHWKDVLPPDPDVYVEGTWLGAENPEDIAKIKLTYQSTDGDMLRVVNYHSQVSSSQAGSEIYSGQLVELGPFAAKLFSVGYVLATPGNRLPAADFHLRNLASLDPAAGVINDPITTDLSVAKDSNKVSPTYAGVELVTGKEIKYKAIELEDGSYTFLTLMTGTYGGHSATIPVLTSVQQ